MLSRLNQEKALGHGPKGFFHRALQRRLRLTSVGLVPCVVTPGFALTPGLALTPGFALGELLMPVVLFCPDWLPVAELLIPPVLLPVPELPADAPAPAPPAPPPPPCATAAVP